MDLRQLKYFVQIVESGSLAKASRQLYIAQPALSQHVAKLEAEVGKPLLIRTAKGVTPTEILLGSILESMAEGLLVVGRSGRLIHVNAAAHRIMPGLAALNRTQVVLWVTIAAVGVNVALNWFLIFGNGGAPELGVQGAAIARWAETRRQRADACGPLQQPISPNQCSSPCGSPPAAPAAPRDRHANGA